MNWIVGFSCGTVLACSLLLIAQTIIPKIDDPIADDVKKEIDEAIEVVEDTRKTVSQCSERLSWVNEYCRCECKPPPLR